MFKDGLDCTVRALIVAISTDSFFCLFCPLLTLFACPAVRRNCAFLPRSFDKNVQHFFSTQSLFSWTRTDSTHEGSGSGRNRIKFDQIQNRHSANQLTPVGWYGSGTYSHQIKEIILILIFLLDCVGFVDKKKICYFFLKKCFGHPVCKRAAVNLCQYVIKCYQALSSFWYSYMKVESWKPVIWLLIHNSFMFVWLIVNQAIGKVWNALIE